MLIDLLWESLDEARIKEIETNWASESEERIDAFDRGELPAVDGPAALQDLRLSSCRSKNSIDSGVSSR